MLTPVLDPAAGHYHPFAPQQSRLQLYMAAVSAKPARSRDDAMARDIGIAALPHHIADRTPGSWTARCGGHVAVRRHTAHTDTTHDRENGSRESRLVV
jgi:hypothetical protein